MLGTVFVQSAPLVCVPFWVSSGRQMLNLTAVGQQCHPRHTQVHGADICLNSTEPACLSTQISLFVSFTPEPYGYLKVSPNVSVLGLVPYQSGSQSK